MEIADHEVCRIAMDDTDVLRRDVPLDRFGVEDAVSGGKDRKEENLKRWIPADACEEANDLRFLD